MVMIYGDVVSHDYRFWPYHHDSSCEFGLKVAVESNHKYRARKQQLVIQLMILRAGLFRNGSAGSSRNEFSNTLEIKDYLKGP